ncbi:hypothetical protein KDM41_01645 [bacterium]|nr:hypothetical protein [bacterium]
MLKFGNHRRDVRWVPILAAVFLLTAGAAALMLADEVRAQSGEGEVKNWKNVTLLYTTDIKGKIEPCG